VNAVYLHTLLFNLEGTLHSSKTSVNFYHTTWHHIPVPAMRISDLRLDVTTFPAVYMIYQNTSSGMMFVVWLHTRLRCDFWLMLQLQKLSSDVTEYFFRYSYQEWWTGAIHALVVSVTLVTDLFICNLFNSAFIFYITSIWHWMVGWWSW
jgi:hypothetical protein